MTTVLTHYDVINNYNKKNNMASSTSLQTDIPYQDVFVTKIKDNTEKLNLLTSKWDDVHKFTFPSR